MPQANPAQTSQPRWEMVAQHLEDLANGPTKQQRKLAQQLKVSLPDGTPTPVAAVLLRHEVREQLVLPFYEDDGRHDDRLDELRHELHLDEVEADTTGTSAEKRAWLETYYMIKTAHGLRQMHADPGDLVICDGWKPNNDVREISSISPNGRVNMKGRPPRRAWPNNLRVIARQGDADFDSKHKESLNSLANNGYQTTNNLDNFNSLHKYRVDSRGPSGEALRELEELLETSTPEESAYQKLIERHPALLASLVVGNHATYVIPQVQLGSDYIADFFVLGISSLGPEWTLVEIEAPRHDTHREDAHLRHEAKHAVEQIDDWRNWLTDNASAIQKDRHFHGLTNQARGLVIIGRDDAQFLRDNARSISGEQKRIDIHSWDWLAREARLRSGNGTYRTIFDTEPDSPFNPGLRRSYTPGEDDLLEVLNDLDIGDEADPSTP